MTGRLARSGLHTMNWYLFPDGASRTKLRYLYDFFEDVKLAVFRVRKEIFKVISACLLLSVEPKEKLFRISQMMIKHSWRSETQFITTIYWINLQSSFIQLSLGSHCYHHTVRPPRTNILSGIFQTTLTQWRHQMCVVWSSFSLIFLNYEKQPTIYEIALVKNSVNLRNIC